MYYRDADVVLVVIDLTSPVNAFSPLRSSDPHPSHVRRALSPRPGLSSSSYDSLQRTPS